jgi:hypothetical protein
VYKVLFALVQFFSPADPAYLAFVSLPIKAAPALEKAAQEVDVIILRHCSRVLLRDEEFLCFLE